MVVILLGTNVFTTNVFEKDTRSYGRETIHLNTGQEWSKRIRVVYFQYRGNSAKYGAYADVYYVGL